MESHGEGCKRSEFYNPSDIILKKCVYLNEDERNEQETMYAPSHTQIGKLESSVGQPEQERSRSSEKAR